MKTILILIAAVASISACGGSPDHTTDITVDNETVRCETDYDQNYTNTVCNTSRTPNNTPSIGNTPSPRESNIPQPDPVVAR